MDEYEVWKQAQLETVAQVACPRCKAQEGTPCEWGTTSNAWSVHKPRSLVAVKARKASR